MMSVYLKPIISACYLFPVLAALFTLPYVIFQYHKYGALLLLRIGIVYTFIFYMMTSYFMTILPLPPIDSVTPSTATVLLVPFDAVRRFLSSSGLVLTDPSTYLAALTNSDFLQIIFNILLLLPFGVYLRYYFNRKWYHVLILSFLYSLFFELTQLSGLYGIYPYPYRFFEVDDLICNTLGGMAGYLITPALLFFLPARERLDEMSYKKGTHVSAFRRLFASLIDFGILFFILFLIEGFTNLYYIIPAYMKAFILPVAAFLYFMLAMLISHGYTIGKFIVNIRIVQSDGRPVRFFQILLRNVLLYLILLPSIGYAAALTYTLSDIPGLWQQIGLIVLSALLVVLSICFGINIFLCFVRRNVQFAYDKICHLKTVSTVVVPDQIHPATATIDAEAAVSMEPTMKDDCDQSEV